MHRVRRPHGAWAALLLWPWVGPARGAPVTSGDGTTPPPAIQCRLQVPATVPAGAPVPLTVVLRNADRRALRVLTWGTPFEGAWRQPFVVVTRDGVAVPYTGALVKRGAPLPGEYLRIPAGGSRRAALDLREAFDLSAPGAYRVVSAIVLHDLRPDVRPDLARGAQRHRVEPTCATVEFRVTP